MSEIQNVPVKTIDGKPSNLGAYAGKVLLVVNVASKCGLTPQYAGLEALYREKQAKGLTVLGFPANDFLQQEPGTEAEIQSFCATTYDVSFPMFSKITVKGANRHALYSALVLARPDATGEGPMRERLKGKSLDSPPPEVLWNFEKFLVDRKGEVVERFAPDVKPDDPRLVAAIDRELAKH